MPRRALPLLLAAILAATLLSGCVEPRAPDLTMPSTWEAFEARLHFDTGAPAVEVRFEAAAPHLDPTLRERAAYELSWGPDDHGGRSGLLLDARLEPVASYECSPACHVQFGGIWDAPFGFGLPAHAYPSDVERLDDGSVWVNSSSEMFHYEPGRLLPTSGWADEVGADGVRRVARQFLVTEYLPAGPAGVAASWPARPDEATPAPRPFLLVPGEDADHFGLGWTPLQAYEDLRARHQDFARQLEGGCVLSFGVHLGAEPYPLMGRPAYALFTVQDGSGRVTEWTFPYPDEVSVPLLDEPFREERDDPAVVPCEQHASMPPLVLDVPGFLAFVEPVAPIGARDFRFEAGREAFMRGDEPWLAPFEYTLVVYDEGTPGFNPHTAYVTVDAAAGQVTYVRLADP